MNKFLKTLIAKGGGLLFASFLLLSACSEKIDDSNLYTFVGQTVEDYLSSNPQFSDFNYILKRTGYDAVLSSYGSYTCFAPKNQYVEAYVDSLYNDTKGELPHNGMTAPGLEGLTDSLCQDIAFMHLLYSKRQSVDMTTGRSFLTILGRDINVSTDGDGHILLNGTSMLSDTLDIEVENGIVQEIVGVIGHSNNLLPAELANDPEFSIFDEALVMTGLADSVSQTRRLENGKPWEYTGDTKMYNTSAQGTRPLYVPRECRLGYTIFAETNATLNQHGIFNFDDLVKYANEQYGNSAEPGSGWYDYYRNNNVKVSTGDDYRSSTNALNMFIRYHLLEGWLRPQDLAYNPGTSNRYAMSQDCPAVTYFTTMLPNTMIRINYETALQQYYINRWHDNSTLTDQPLGLGSAAMHAVRDPGVLISDNASLQSSNGSIFPLNDMLVYKQDVPRNIFNERMRFDVPTLMPELFSNRYMHLSPSEMTNMYPEGMNDNMYIPDGFLSRLVSYNGDQSEIQFNPSHFNGNKEMWYWWQDDCIRVTGNYDVALLLPPVPDGNYEIRLGYEPITTGTGNRSMTQMYLGVNTNDINKMIPLDIPIDMRPVPNPTNGGKTPDYRTGWINPDNTDDGGLETDQAMRNQGYMRAPKGMLVARGDGLSARNNNNTIRQIIGKVQIKQGRNWLRFKSVLDDKTRQLHLDYIEIVPEDIYNNDKYTEDMY